MASREQLLLQSHSTFSCWISSARIPFVTAPQSSSSLDSAFLSVWRQTLVDRATEVYLEGKTYLVRRTAKRRLAQVDFELDGVSYRALEQNPQTKSRWAAMARGGAKVMQFLAGGRYIAVVADARLTRYTRSRT